MKRLMKRVGRNDGQAMHYLGHSYSEGVSYRMPQQNHAKALKLHLKAGSCKCILQCWLFI